MDQKRIWEIALAQSAIDMNCRPEDFMVGENRIFANPQHPDARKYLPLPFECQFVSYGPNLVVSCREEVIPAVRTYMEQVSVSHAFETPNIHLLDRLLMPYGLETNYMAEFFLPEMKNLKKHTCAYEMRMMYPEDFQALYLPQWGNALCADRKHLDVLGVGAYDGGKLVGFAACSADGVQMWQIGIDVLPEYRRQGIAAALTSRLTDEILQRDKVPFYSAAWCNVASVRNAVKCGYSPAWVELSVRDVTRGEREMK